MLEELPILFPFHEHWWFYVGFTLFILGMLALDLGVFHRKAHEVSFKEAAAWSVVWVSLALLFGWGFYYYALNTLSQNPHLALAGSTPEIEAERLTLEYLTGFIVEKSLALDNIFIFVVVFKYFSIPLKYQHRVLFFGILGALLFRTIFIAAGTLLLEFKLVVYLFGALLILTGFKIFFAPEKPLDPGNNAAIKFLRKFLPVTAELHGQRFFIRQGSKLLVTPLFLGLVFVEISDILFAFDSVPAIFALTREPLIVFTSNVFAILGLRAMFFLLASVVHRFRYLKYGLGAVLIFVGLKMVYLNELYGGKFPITWSLAIISAAIGSSVVASLLFSTGNEEK